MRRYTIVSTACLLAGLSAGLILEGSPTRAAREAEAPRVSVSQLVDRVPTGLLGKPVGTKLVVEGVRAEQVLLENPLRVEKVDGQPLAQPVAIELKKGEDLKPGVHYKFEGYESGAFAGEPEWLNANVQQPFQYRPSFVVTHAVESEK